MHVSTSLYTRVNGYAPSQASIFKPWDSGTPGLPGQCTASGHQKPWLWTSLLSAVLAHRALPKQVVRALLLAVVEHMF